ncbi:hypothetical protein EC973_006870 [Apophysomyces ossiformis]|uniref:Uncharacterized protein n=1 Tax=Apophysomyces ossiformis TaxID=679940 RepID=A0A8H7BE82_9FUNG|nr:hypothetical protein EC973_006870 [Apophysomyces ossiformis]
MNSSKRLHSPTSEYDEAVHSKRYVSEKVLRDMASMSLYGNSCDFSHRPRWRHESNRSSHVERIDDIDEYLADDENKSDDEGGDLAIDMDKVTLIEAYINGNLLPMEMHPGEAKLRIPKCILQASAEQTPQAKVGCTDTLHLRRVE